MGSADLQFKACGLNFFDILPLPFLENKFLAQFCLFFVQMQLIFFLGKSLPQLIVYFSLFYNHSILCHYAQILIKLSIEKTSHHIQGTKYFYNLLVRDRLGLQRRKVPDSGSCLYHLTFYHMKRKKIKKGCNSLVKYLRGLPPRTVGMVRKWGLKIWQPTYSHSCSLEIPACTATAN